MFNASLEKVVGDYIVYGNDLVFIDSLGDVDFKNGSGSELTRFKKVKVVDDFSFLVDYLESTCLESLVSDGIKSVQASEEGLFVTANKDSYPYLNDLLLELEQSLDKMFGFELTNISLNSYVWVQFV